MSQTPKSSSVDTSLESTESSIKLPVVKNSLETKGVLQFTLENTNVSIANAIRRTILSDIPIVIIDTKHKKFNILQNTTRFNNEILKQRLGCIPIHIKSFDAINDLIVELNETNNKESLEYITTKNFKIKNITSNTYLTDAATKKIFPSNKLTECYILFTRLRPKISNDIPGETIQIIAKLGIGTAREDGMYNIVSTCAYGNTPDKVEQEAHWHSISENLEQKGINTQDIDYKRQNWYTLEAKRYYKDDSFDFKIESVGVYSNIEIVNKACDILINKLKVIKQASDTQTLELNKDTTAMKNCVDIKLVGEDYTIGKVMEYIIHHDYYLEDQTLSYIGFIKLHPHDDFSIIRMAFTNEELFTNANIYNIIGYICESGINIFTNLKEYF